MNREFWLNIYGGGRLSPLLHRSQQAAKFHNMAKFEECIHVREVLPNDITPDQVIESVCEFLMNEAGNYCKCKNAYGEQCDKHAMTWTAHYIQSNKSKILGEVKK